MDNFNYTAKSFIAQHLEIRELLEDLRNLLIPIDVRKEQFKTLVPLFLHNLEEEESFVYQHLLRSTSTHMNELANEGMSDHTIAASLAYELENSNMGDVEWTEHSILLSDFIELHFDDEEQILFNELSSPFFRRTETYFIDH